MDLSAKEIERAKFTFSVYDVDEKNQIDATLLGPALRALGLTPSLALISELGGTTRSGEKTLSVEEFLPIFSAAKKNKDVGTLEDFMECMRSNDKHGDGKISSDQLSHLLQAYGKTSLLEYNSMGERLDPDEINEVIHDCGNLEEGFLSYAPFLKNLLNGPDLESHSFEQTPSDLPNQEKPIPVLNMSNAKPMESDSCSSPSAAFTLKAPKQRSQSVVEDPNPKSAAATAAFTLKTPAKSKTEEDKKASKAAAAAAVAAELKPKNQQPLISMKMMAMIGNIK